MLASCFAVLAQMIVFPGINGDSVGEIADFLIVTVSDSSSLVNAFFMELILTFILVYVIFATAFDTGTYHSRSYHSRHQGRKGPIQGWRRAIRKQLDYLCNIYLLIIDYFW